MPKHFFQQWIILTGYWPSPGARNDFHTSKKIGTAIVRNQNRGERERENQFLCHA